MLSTELRQGLDSAADDLHVLSPGSRRRLCTCFRLISSRAPLYFYSMQKQLLVVRKWLLPQLRSMTCMGTYPGMFAESVCDTCGFARCISGLLTHNSLALIREVSGDAMQHRMIATCYG